ncbi:LLM class flavin-dependent oxidoreductase [Actinomadura rupiterrae]|uniref:LLM class flavin-dependent oxidoreductase n=1 Tax=Actinomadura rupiterrae TaxID=559627 RepID=UPI0020A434C4|nr:LLM class flavin-dependent oxidoreductase [Actinomadura rupiterrae]MCP2340766.1 alkanesulfonate monooxygenase SsuD/methylene tetrahydromethanopterin reductase-like flavin-dependent oxidoreductase (luciferase family) [Actinomadura rupiterrae]
MPDYRHDLLFGVFLSPAVADMPATMENVRLAESLGLDLVGMQDHPYHPGFADTPTLLTRVALATRKITVFPDVASLPLRGPVTLASWAATLAEISGGRVRARPRLRRAPGRDRRARRPVLDTGPAGPGAGRGRRVVRGLLDGRPGHTVEGEFYRLRDAPPILGRPFDVPLWLGGYRPRTLNLIGLPRRRLDPVLGLHGPGRDGRRVAADRRGGHRRRTRPGGRPPPLQPGRRVLARRFGRVLHGPPKVWADQLAELALELGVSGFVLSSGRPADIELFAREVVPAVREEVNRARST